MAKKYAKILKNPNWGKKYAFFFLNRQNIKKKMAKNRQKTERWK